MSSGSSDSGLSEEVVGELKSKLDEFLAKAEDICRGMDAEERKRIVRKVVDDLVGQARERIRAEQDESDREVVDAEQAVAKFVSEYVEAHFNILPSRVGPGRRS